jgi:hypothetical protein
MPAAAQTFLNSLLRSAKVKPRHEWQDLADLIGDCDVLRINAWGLTVPLEDGTRTVAVPGGWTEEHYQFLAPDLEPWPKAMLARAVLEREFLRAGYQEWDTAWWLLRELQRPHDEKDWLPALVRDEGFAAITTRMGKLVTDYLRANPPRRLVVDVAARRVTWLGQDHQVTEEQALLLDLLHKNLGRRPLTEKACMKACPRLAGGHFHRLREELPAPLSQITRSRQGCGWWLELV